MAMNTFDSEVMVRRLLESDNVDDVLAQVQERHDEELARVSGGAAGGASRSTALSTAGQSLSRDPQHNHNAVVYNSVENPLTVFTSGVVTTTTSLHRVAVERRSNSATTSVHEHHTVNMSELTSSQRANSFADVQQDRRSMSLISPALENESEASTNTQKRRIMAPANNDDDDDGAFPDFHRPAGNRSSGKDRFTPPLPPSARHLSPTMFAEGNHRNNVEHFPHHQHRSLPPSTLASEADEGEVLRPASANGDGHRERSGSYPILPSSNGLGSFGSSGIMQRYLDHGSLRSHSSPPAHYHDDVRPPRGSYVGPQKRKKKTIPPPANTPSPGKKSINHTDDYKRAATALSPTSKLNISSRAQLSRQALRRNYAELVAARPPPPPDPSFLAYHDGPSLLLRQTLACDEGDVSATSIISTGRGGAAGTVSPPRRVAANGTRYVPDPFLLHAPFGYQAPLEDDLEGFDGSGTSPGQRSGSHQEGNNKRSRRGSATLAKVPSNINLTAVPTVLSSHALKLLASPKASGTPIVNAPSGVPDVDESSSAVGGIYEVGTNQQRSFEVGEGEPLTDDEDHPRIGAGGNVVPVVGTSRDNNRRVIEHQQHVQSRNPRAAKTTAMSKFRNSLLVVSAPRHPHQQQSGTSQSLIGGGIAGSGLSSPDSQHIVPLGPGGVVVHGRTDTLDSMGINHVVDYFEHSGSHVVSAMDELSTLKPLAANPSNNSIKSSVNQRNGGRKGSVGGKSSGSNNKPPSSTGSSAAAAHAPPAAVLAAKKQQQERAAEWMSPASPLGRDDDFAVPPRSSPRGQSEGGLHSDHDNDDDYTYDYSYTYSSYYTASDRDGDSDGSGSYGTTSSDAPPPRRVATCGADDAPVPKPRTSVPKPSSAAPPAKVGAKSLQPAKNSTGNNAPGQPASPQRLTNSSLNGPTQGPSPADWILRGKGSFALGAPATNALMRFNAALEGVGKPVSSVASVSSAQEVTPAMNNNNSQQPRRALNARRDGNIYREPSMRTATRFQRMRTPLTATTKTSTATPHSGPGGGPLGRSFTSALNHNGSMARRPPMTPTSATYRNGPTTEFLPFASETSGAVHPSSPAFGGMQPHQQQFQQQLPPRTPRFAHPQQQQSLLLHQSVQFPQQLSSGNTSRSASAAFISSTAVVAPAALPTAHQHTQPPAPSKVSVQAPTNPRQIVWESKGHVEVPPASQQHDISSSTGAQQDRFHVPAPQDPSSAAPISSTSSSRFAPPATAPVVYRSGSRGTTASKATGGEQHYTEDAQRGDTVAQHGSGDNLSSPNGGSSRRLNSQDNNALPGRSVSTMSIGIPHSRSASSGPAAQQQPYHPVPVARVSAEYQGRSASFYDPQNRSASASSIQQRFGIQVK